MKIFGGSMLLISIMGANVNGFDYHNVSGIIMGVVLIIVEAYYAKR